MTTYWQTVRQTQLETEKQVNRIASQVNQMWPGTVSRQLMDRLGRLSKSTSQYESSAFRRTHNGYEARFEVPGYKRENIEVLVDPGVRQMRVVVTERIEGDSVETDKEEIVYDTSLPVPNGASFRETTAKLDMGILTVTFSEDEEAKPQSIDITVE